MTPYCTDGTDWLERKKNAKYKLFLERPLLSEITKAHTKTRERKLKYCVRRLKRDTRERKYTRMNNIVLAGIFINKIQFEIPIFLFACGWLT